jgi:hypothetical protein
MAGWTHLYDLLKEEFVQRADEGCIIPDELRARFAALDPKACLTDSAAAESLYDTLMALPEDPVLATREPNDLAAIRALRPDGPRNFHWQPTEAELLDRLHGAWTGRAVGCALGKPVEGMGMGRDEHGKLNGRKNIRRYLESRGDYPLHDFFSLRDAGDGLKIGCDASCRENIAYMEPDDDIHYSLVGLGVLEKHGGGFTWRDVAEFWLSRLPVTAICTAEAQAILNYQNLSWRCGTKPMPDPVHIRRLRNPYREWIGAQIRADGWAFCCAGNPEKAAEFAWRDAHWTHERNGIYGEMMFAAMQAAAFVEPDCDRLIDIGLSEIPRDCRLARWVARCREWMRECPDFESCMDRLEAELGDMHAVHTINNALICLVGLHYGKMDTSRSIAIAVMSALDTDCNGATVGSIVGAAAGRKAFGGALAVKLNDEIRPLMFGFEIVKMRDLAARCAKVRQLLAKGE